MVLVVSDDIDVFTSLERAMDYFEPWQLERMQFKGWDYFGRPLAFRENNESVEITITQNPEEKEQLIGVLHKFLNQRSTYPATNAPLDHLFELCRPHVTS